MLGLDRGGACRGVAFRVAEKNSAATIAYLREREQVTSVYREVKKWSVWLENEARERVSALVYVVDRGHVQYAGRLSPAEQLRHVLQGHGQSGVNRDYVLATVKAIEAEGFRDSQLHRLAVMLHDTHAPPPKQGAKDAVLDWLVASTRNASDLIRQSLAAAISTGCLKRVTAAGSGTTPARG